MKVLIVDDDRVSRMLLGHIIAREFDGAITEAINGIEALDVLKRQTFDFILLDLMMPVMDGLQTLEAIRAQDSFRRLPVVILSAVKEEAKVRRILQLGVADYLAKPLHPKGIVQRLRRIVPAIARQQAADAAAAVAAVDGASPGGTHANAAAPAAGPFNEPKVELVVADADPNFRNFVRTMLGSEYRIIEAESGARALRRCYESRPAMLLLGEGLGPVDRTLLIRKLRADADLKATHVIGLVASARAEPTSVDALCDALLVRTFKATVFREQFARLAREIGPAGGTGQIVAGVRLELVSTVEQVFGMMLDVEVEQLSAHPQIPGVWITAEVDLEVLREDFTLTVLCACPGETGGRIAHLMQHTSSDWVGDDLAAAALGDIATIIAERLQRTLAEQRRRVKASVAAVRRGPAQFGEPGLLRLSFNSTNGDLPFHVAVRGDRKGASAGMMVHGARTM